MARVKFKFSKTIRVGEQSTETFEASEADSWEEARKIVEKGVYDRSLELSVQRERQTKTASPNQTLSSSNSFTSFPGVGVFPSSQITKS